MMKLHVSIDDKRRMNRDMLDSLGLEMDEVKMYIISLMKVTIPFDEKVKHLIVLPKPAQLFQHILRKMRQDEDLENYSENIKNKIIVWSIDGVALN